jgi:hypothetical protein
VVDRSGSNRHVVVPFASVEEAIARRGEGKGLQFYDDLVATHPGATATELAKFVLSSLGVGESAQKSSGVRTRYGNDVQAIAARVREARKRAAGPGGALEPSDGVDAPQAWAARVEAVARRDPAYLAALIRVLRQSGHLDS